LVNIDACKFRVIVVTDPQINTQTDRDNYNKLLCRSLARSVVITIATLLRPVVTIMLRYVYTATPVNSL